jgi:hypothetical protein
LNRIVKMKVSKNQSRQKHHRSSEQKKAAKKHEIKINAENFIKKLYTFE